MKRTCITCHHHLTERGRIVCGLDGKCEWGECYEPMRGSLEEMQMAIDPWKKAQALYEAKLLNWKDMSNEDKPVISVFDKQHNTISSGMITTDNPEEQSWLKSFMQIDKDGKETEI